MDANEVNSNEETPAIDDSAFANATTLIANLKKRLRLAVRGRDDVIDLVLCAFLADGHVLLEDYPGSGKTTLARALGDAVSGGHEQIAPFRRIQFTPDLLPTDITGTTVVDLHTNTLSFRPGPVFAHVVLADEINRTSPKVQSALLEAMAEKQVSVDNKTHSLDELFFVIATQNPVDLAGTYPLPKPQLDRFLFKIKMEHISKEAELDVLASYPKPTLIRAEDDGVLVEQGSVISAREAIRQGVRIADSIRHGLVDIAHAIRADERVYQGVSTRSLVLMLPALQVWAFMQGRDFVIPDDVKSLLPRVLGHRIDATSSDEILAIIHENAAPIFDKMAKAEF